MPHIQGIWYDKKGNKEMLICMLVCDFCSGHTKCCLKKMKNENGVGLKNKSKNPINPLHTTKEQSTHVF